MCVIMTIVSFLSGSVMYSYIIPKLTRHIDIRELSEDKNPGSANVSAVLGQPMGAVCLLSDVLKAFVPVVISVMFLGISGYYLILVIVAPVLGHAFSPFMRFKGGKAVSVSFGSLLGIVGISKAVAVLVVIMFTLTFIVIVKPDSTRVFTAFFLSCIIILAIEPLLAIKIAMSIISFTVCYKHLINPNKGAMSLEIGPYDICFDHRQFKFGRRL